MSLMKILPFAAAVAVVAVASVEATPVGPTSRYSKASQCKEMASGDVDKGEDWVYARCEGLGGIPIWYFCLDSNKCRYGFGRKANLSSGIIGVDGDPEWPIEWRGRMASGKFKPFAVIMRGRPYGLEKKDGSPLSVIRLRADGLSCLVGDDIKSNEAARRIADAAEIRFTCTEEPRDPNSKSPIW